MLRRRHLPLKDFRAKPLHLPSRHQPHSGTPPPPSRSRKETEMAESDKKSSSLAPESESLKPETDAATATCSKAAASSLVTKQLKSLLDGITEFRETHNKLLDTFKAITEDNSNDSDKRQLISDLLPLFEDINLSRIGGSDPPQPRLVKAYMRARFAFEAVKLNDEISETAPAPKKRKLEESAKEKPRTKLWGIYLSQSLCWLQAT